MIQINHQPQIFNFEFFFFFLLKGLKAGPGGPGGPGEESGGFRGFPGGGGGFSGGSFRFRPTDADDIFAQMFGGRNAFGRGFSFSRGGGGFGGEEDEDMEESGYGGFPGGGFQSGPRKAPPIKRDLECTLEELYRGRV